MADAIPAADAGLLAAQAQSGLQGVEAYKQAQATLQQQRQSAVQTAMQEAAMRGAPVGAAESQQSIITQPYDQRLASLAQGQAGFQADMAARDRRMTDYNAAIGNARTLIPGQVEMAVAPIRAQGEATIANTTRQGEMAVSEIEANTRLALAKMQAAEAAAARARSAAAAKAKKLTGTDLEAMLAQGAQQVLGKSIGDTKTLVTSNEAAATAAAAAKTKMNPATYVTSWGASAAPKLKQSTVVGGNGMAAPLNGAYSLSTGATAMPKLQQATVTRQATQADALARGIASGRVNPGGDSGMTGYESVPEQGGMKFPVPRGTGYETMPEAPARPRTPSTPVTAPWGPPAGAARAPKSATPPDLARQIAALLKARQGPSGISLSRADLQQWLSKYGSVSMDQLQSMVGTDPLAASLITGAPNPITSGTIDETLAGTPDISGQANPYAVNAASTARQIVRDRLRAAGYDISDEDFANATTDAMKPGESLAQYQARASGQKDPAALADAAKKKFVGDIEYSKLAGQYDEQGNPLVDENGIAMNLTPDQRKSALNDQARTWITQGAGMPLPTGNQFGSEADIQALIQAGGSGDSYPLVDAYQQLAANSGGIGFNTKQWRDQVAKLAPYKLSPTQIALLKSILYQPSLDTSGRSDE